MKKLLSAAFILTSLAAFGADEAGLQIAVTPEMALQSSSTTIHGLTWNILCGENPQRGLTFGLANGSSGESSGFTLGLVNYGNSYSGVEWGLVNVTTAPSSGWQFGAFNFGGENYRGFQWGVVNVATEFHGFQLGCFNYVDRLRGLQLGLINIATESAWFGEFPKSLAPAIVFLNWSF
jgi:hypothetical protein